MDLKPDTPLWAKLRIMQIERERERIITWIYRLTIAIELLLIMALGACVISFYMIRGVRTLQELKKRAPV